ncbi:aldehyde dehydrogenase (NADP(+)), partial [Paracoccus thiocyanatus]
PAAARPASRWPRPDLRLMQRPIGPVAVFGASNFPLAFSTAGGDTASALAAGCPVVVKGHPAHPGTGEIVAQAIDAAIRATAMPAGTFSFIHGDSHEVGAALVRHPLIRAVGFTGSLRGGRALYDLCAARPEPIPFFGELGSINPVFVLPHAAAARGRQIAQGWTASLTMGAGQFCTNPGLLVLPAAAADAVLDAASAALADAAEQVMLTEGIAAAYCEGRDRIAGMAQAVLESDSRGRNALPSLYRTTADAFLASRAMGEEVFGPLGLAVTVRDDDEMLDLARALEGQLTATLQMDQGDMALAGRLMPVLERKAGRVLANGWPTGVEVADAMVHGGPYPASTNFGATSVGTMAIRRFLRPVCYQDLPDVLLPEDLRG